MTSYYDDGPSRPQHGRAQVPVPGAGPEPYDSEFDPFAPEHQQPSYDAPVARDPYADPFADPYADPYAAPPPPPAPAAGRAGVGRASVRPAEFDDSYREDPYARPNESGAAYGFDEGFDPFGGEERPRGAASASVPQTPLGTASVPAGRAGAGRASVPVPGAVGAAGVAGVAGVAGGAAGRATVGRATIPSQTRPDGTPGGPQRPGGPAGPGGPGGPAGGASGKGKGKKPVNKKARRRNRILAGLASLIMLTGLLVVVGTYYSTTVQLPENVAVPQATRLLYSNGKQMATIGTQTRYLVTLDQIPKIVRDAVVATEDDTFYTNVGVDFKGIARAFVNNVTGGDTQGASTITQQYARASEGLTFSESYTRKIKEAFIAVKLTHSWTKDHILEAYLNTVPFGRGAYGIKAAALAYFNKSLDKITPSEAFVLADVIKDPNGTGGGPAPFDPSCRTGTGKTATVCQTALQRWNYTKTMMAKHPEWISPAALAQTAYPTDEVPWSDVETGTNTNMTTPIGYIVHKVLSELNALKANGKPMFTSDQLMNGGYTITTTIDQGAQEAANKIFNIQDKGSPVYGYVASPKAVVASMVSIYPQNGGVAAYYGGPNGAGIDYAGVSYDPILAQEKSLSGGHRDPGSSLKTMTMAAALSAGYGIDSMWYGPHQLSRPNGQAPLHNNGGDDCKRCTMLQGLKKSTNTMFYSIAQKVGVGNVIDMMQKLGVQYLWSDTQNKRYALTPNDGKQIAQDGGFGNELGFGQGGVALEDLAHAISTIANEGVLMPEHFVTKVTEPGASTTPVTLYQVKPVGHQVADLTAQQTHDEMYAMQQVMANADENGKSELVPGLDNQLDGGRPAAAKTGTWELSDQDPTDDGVSAFNGYTAPGAGQLCTSVWVGSAGKATPLRALNPKTHQLQRTAAGKPVILGGAKLAGPLWKTFMNAALRTSDNGKPAPVEQFPAPDHTGSKKGPAELVPSAPPSAPPNTQQSAPPQVMNAPNVQIHQGNGGNVTVSWGGISGAVHYVVTRTPGSQGTTTNTSVTDNNLQPGSTYRYTVVAVDGQGHSSPPGSASVTIGGGNQPPGSGTPSPPGNLNADASNPADVKVTWKSAGNVNGYSVTVLKGGQQVSSQTTGQTHVDLTGLGQGQYTVRVKSIGSGGTQSSAATAIFHIN